MPLLNCYESIFSDDYDLNAECLNPYSREKVQKAPNFSESPVPGHFTRGGWKSLMSVLMNLILL